LRREAVTALQDMAKDFFSVFGAPISIVSSYRSYWYQTHLFSSYREKYGEARARGFSAKPWYSEHQLWLAIDIFDLSSQQWWKKEKYFQRMRANAHTYGRTQSYQKWLAVDGYIVEPRHWRYVWVDLATYLRENKMTFGEYVRFRWIWRG
jgi:D-alanyl-D-alanine carboxypeptidase